MLRRELKVFPAFSTLTIPHHIIFFFMTLSTQNLTPSSSVGSKMCLLERGTWQQHGMAQNTILGTVDHSRLPQTIQPALVRSVINAITTIASECLYLFLLDGYLYQLSCRLSIRRRRITFSPLRGRTIDIARQSEVLIHHFYWNVQLDSSSPLFILHTIYLGFSP